MNMSRVKKWLIAAVRKWINSTEADFTRVLCRFLFTAVKKKKKGNLISGDWKIRIVSKNLLYPVALFCLPVCVLVSV